MYKKKQNEQITFYDYNQGFGFPIDENNRWAQLAKKIPWKEAEDLYAENFKKNNGVDTGNVAIPFRTAMGALIIRRVFGISDRDTVKLIQESPYLQYFIGLPKYAPVPPFDPSMMTHFRKRIDLDAMETITDMIVEFEKKTAITKNGYSADDDFIEEQTNTDKASVLNEIIFAAGFMAIGVLRGAKSRKGAWILGNIKNRGTLIIDASCSPVNIRYPQDFSLLNEAREQLETILNRLCKENKLRKPRTQCRIARKKYLDLSKSKRRSTKKIRSVVRYQLNRVKNNLRFIGEFQKQGYDLRNKEEKQIEIIQTLYDQQKYMYDTKVKRVDDRIVSLQMPFIRPIVRGKVPNPTEFGPKYDLSVDTDGNCRIEYFSYDAYNESTHLRAVVEAYTERTGTYPERVLVDEIYRNKANRKFCKDLGIRMSGPPLGRPSKDNEKTKAEKKREKQDMVERIKVERHFSREKRCFGLDRIMEKTEATIGSSTGLGVLLDNLIPVGF